jgi:hypothetical protein
MNNTSRAAFLPGFTVFVPPDGYRIRSPEVVRQGDASGAAIDFQVHLP